MAFDLTPGFNLGISDKLKRIGRAFGSFAGSDANTVNFTNPTGAGGETSGSGLVSQDSLPSISTDYSRGLTTGSGGQVEGAATVGGDTGGTSGADAQAGSLRTEVTNLVNRIKDIFNSRYGQIDSAANEQVTNLNDRFGNESADLIGQIGAANQQIGSQHAAAGTYDSSYRGNDVDTTTRAGESQITDLGNELRENMGKVGAFRAQGHAGLDAGKAGMDAILGRLGEVTDINELTSLRDTLDGRINELSAGNADYNTQAQNAAGLGAAGASARAVQLKSTLDRIKSGNADTAQKSAIAERLISSANLSPEDKQALMIAFREDLNATDQRDKSRREVLA